MGMVVRTNTMAINAQRQLNLNNNKVSKSLEKLASGYKINRAGDDAAGLAISERMKAQIKGLDAASTNSQDGISLVQTAEGALNEVHDMLNRMVELATKAANGVYTESQRGNYADEVAQLKSEIDRIADSTNFNSLKLLDGTMGLNTSAFTIGDGGAAATGAAIDLVKGIADADIHEGTATVGQTAPSFAIDLGDYNLTGTGNDADLSISIGGATITLTGVDLDAGKGTTEEIAKAIADEWNKTAGTTDTIGGLSFTAAAGADGKITFTYAGLSANAGAMDASDEFTQTEADAFNAAVGQGVTMTYTAGADTEENGDVIHAAVDVTSPVVAVTGARAGIDKIDISDAVVNGGKLTIEDKTYVFKTDADSDVKAGAGEELIDVSGWATDAEKIQDAVNQLSNKSTSNFEIGAVSGTEIAIDQTAASAATGKTYNAEQLKAQISAKGPDTTASTKISITNNNVKNGDALKIDGTTYTFVDAAKATGAANEVIIGADGDTTAANLAKAIGGSANAAGSVVTVSAANATASAPAVLGGGLVLQVGEIGRAHV